MVETERPIELNNLFMVGDRASPDPLLIPTLVDGRANPDGQRFDLSAPVAGRGRPRRRWFTPRRIEVVDQLQDLDLLPAIYFIFSRAACDDAVMACLDAGIRLVDVEARARIDQIVEEHVAALSDRDLEVLGFSRFRAGLHAGLAAHHAGMVPPFKEAVERCFGEGLVRAVFATETLALGINMPARSVVIEKLTKFTGERHEFLSPGQYTQLTGRAGRRGIDTTGHAVVLWSPFVSFGEVAGLAASRSFGLTSSFRPTYNMAANLVRRYPAQMAHHLLNLSFAQFQADQAVVHLETRLGRRQATLSELLAGRHLRARRRRGVPGPGRRGATRGPVAAASARRGAEPPATGRRHQARGREVGRAGGRADGGSTQRRHGAAAGHHRPAPGHEPGQRRLRPPTRGAEPGHAAHALRPQQSDLPAGGGPGPVPRRCARPRPGSRRRGSQSTSQGAAAGPDHPVAGCPDLDQHLRAARQAERVAREVADLKRQIQGRTESLARRFDQVLRLLEAWGHLDGWALTERGERLVRIFHESDLLMAEALETGLLDDLDPASLAGMVSCLTYEHRSPNPPDAPWFPSAEVRRRVMALDQLAADLNLDEAAAGLPASRPPDPGFFALAYAWAAGEALDDVLADEDLSGGDFVRNVKLLIDLLGQVAEAAPNPATARTARQATDQILRGVVAASSVAAEP